MAAIQITSVLSGFFFYWQADIDNSGTIDYGEFLAATVHLNKLEREENLVSAFSFFDKDGSGYITIDELQQACKDFGLSELHLDEMISEIDQDNVSVQPNLDELLGWLLPDSSNHHFHLSNTWVHPCNWFTTDIVQ